MGPPHEGSIRRPIAPLANALTTELHLAWVDPMTLHSMSRHSATKLSPTPAPYYWTKLKFTFRTSVNNSSDRTIVSRPPLAGGGGPGPGVLDALTTGQHNVQSVALLDVPQHTDHLVPRPRVEPKALLQIPVVVVHRPQLN